MKHQEAYNESREYILDLMRVHVSSETERFEIEKLELVELSKMIVETYSELELENLLIRIAFENRLIYKKLDDFMVISKELIEAKSKYKDSINEKELIEIVENLNRASRAS